jgi:hypothetical protein
MATNSFILFRVSLYEKKSAVKDLITLSEGFIKRIVPPVGGAPAGETAFAGIRAYNFLPSQHPFFLTGCSQRNTSPAVESRVPSDDG